MNFKTASLLIGCLILTACSNVAQSPETVNNETDAQVSVESQISPAVDTNLEQGSLPQAQKPTGEPEPAKYLSYSRTVDSTLHGKQAYVLFFNAENCKSCGVIAANIKSDLKEFSPGTVIVEADFAKEDELKRKFSVTSAGSVLVFDAKGELKADLINPTLAKIKSEFDKLVTP